MEGTTCPEGERTLRRGLGPIRAPRAEGVCEPRHVMLSLCVYDKGATTNVAPCPMESTIDNGLS